MRAIAIVAVLVVAGCGGGAAGVDAGPCDGTTPGARVHLSFDTAPAFAPSWTPLDDVLHMQTTGGWEEYRVPAGVVDSTRHAVVPLAYPAGTTAGPATVSFYAIGPAAIGNWGSASATFTADPSACVDVDLYVPFVSMMIDAGPADGG